MADHPNFFRKFVGGLCLQPIDTAPNAKTETGITTSGAIWVYANKLKAYLDSAVREMVSTDQTQTLTNKTIDADNNTVSNLEVDNLKAGVLDTDLSSVSASDDTIPSAKATKAYVDSQVTAQDLDLAADSGTASVDLDSETLTISGGTGIDTTASDVGPEVTVAIDSTVTQNAATQSLTNKTIDADLNTVSNIANDEIKAAAGIDASKIGAGSVDNTEFQYLNGVTDYVQDQIDTKITADETVALTNKTIDADLNTISNIDNDEIKANAQIDATKIAPGTISNTEFSYLNNATSNIQDQIDNKADDTDLSNHISNTTTHGATGAVVGTTNTQTLTNKTLTSPEINFGTIVSPTRLDVKQDTEANLTTYAATATNGQLCFATDTKKMYQVVDSALTEVGAGGGAGDADTIHLIQSDDLASTSDIDLQGQGSDFDAGGTITPSALTLSTTSTDLLKSSDQVIKYDPNTDGQNDYFGFTKAIPLAYRGRYLGFQFEAKNDSTTVDNDFRFCVKQKDGTNAGNIQYFNMDSAYKEDNAGTTFKFQAYIWTDCTEIEFGWQNTSTTTTVQMVVDNILVSSNAFIDKQILEEQFLYHAAQSSTLLARASGAAIRFDSTNFTSSGAGIFSYDETTGRFTANKAGSGVFLFSGRSATSAQTLYLYKNGTSYNNGTEAGNSVTNDACITAPVKFEAGDYFHFQAAFALFNSTDTVFVNISAQALVDGVAFSTSDPDNYWSARINASLGASFTVTEVTGFSGVSVSRVGTGQYTLDYSALNLTTRPKISPHLPFNNTNWIFVDTDLTYDENECTIEVLTTTTARVDADFTVDIVKSGIDYLPITGTIITPLTRTAYIKDAKSSGTFGGTFTSGAWQTRTLNTLSGDTSFIILSGGTTGTDGTATQFTLPSGKYRFKAIAPAFVVQSHKAKLRNITDSSDEILGSSEECDSAGATAHVTSSIVEGEINISETKTFELQHRCSTTGATSGFGRAVNFGVDEVYAQIEITKLI